MLMYSPKEKGDLLHFYKLFHNELNIFINWFSYIRDLYLNVLGKIKFCHKNVTDFFIKNMLQKLPWILFKVNQLGFVSHLNLNYIKPTFKV